MVTNKGVFEPVSSSMVRLIMLSLRYWWRSTLTVGGLLAIIFVVTGLYDYLLTLEHNHYVITGAIIVFGLLQAYCWALCLYRIYFDLSQHELSLRKAIKYISARFLRIIGYLAAVVFAGIVVYQLATLLILLLHHAFAIKALPMPNIVYLIAGIAYTLMIILSVIAMPVMLIEDMSVIPAVARAFRISIKQWLRPFVIYLMLFIISCVVIVPHFLSIYMGWSVFWLGLLKTLIGVVMIPLMMNLILFCYQDLSVRFKEQSE